jgi:hypothetical protein
MRFRFLICIILVSCQGTDKEPAFGTEGNTQQVALVKVIDHYRQCGNREKIAAAQYLIENIRDKYSLEGKALSDMFGIYKYIDELYHGGIKDFRTLDSIAAKQIDSLFAYNGPVLPETLKRIRDVERINPDSVILCIDLAFEAWKTKPWARHVNFKQFCEFILPYRVYNEPLQYWRPYLKNKYDIFEDSLKHPEDPKDLVRKVNAYLYKEWKHLDSFNKCSYLPGVIDIDRYSGGLES